MREYDEYYERPRVKAKTIDLKELKGSMLWALLGAFFLAGGIVFFSLTF